MLSSVGLGRLALACVACLTLSSAAEENSCQPAPVRTLKIVGDQETRIEGTLTAQDPKHKGLGGKPHHIYEIKLSAGVHYKIDLMSKAFDCFLRLEDLSGKELASDDDSGGGTNARIAFTAPKDAAYRIVVTTFDGKLGAYVLAVRIIGAADKKKYDMLAKATKLLENAREWYMSGQFAKVEPVLRQAVEIRRKWQPDHHDTATLCNNLALTLDRLKKHREAEPLHREALTIYRKSLGEKHADTAMSFANLADNLAKQGRDQDAEELYRRALTIRRKVLGAEHAETAVNCSRLASSLSHLGRHEEAGKLLGEALTIHRKIQGEWHRETAVSYHNLGVNLERRRKTREAEEHFRKALEIERKIFGEEHLETAASYRTLAINLQTQARYQEAEELNRKVLALYRKLRGEEDRDTASAYKSLALNLREQGRYAEAEQHDRKALAIRRKVLGEEHPDTAWSYGNLASDLWAQGRGREAEKLHRKSLEIRLKVRGREHLETALGYSNLATVLSEQGLYEEAEKTQRLALVIRRRQLGDSDPELATSYGNLAFYLRMLGRAQEAEQLQRKALEIRIKNHGPSHPDAAHGYEHLAATLQSLDQAEEAAALFGKSLNIRRKVLGEVHPRTADSYTNVSNVLKMRGRLADAEQMNRKALEIRRQLFGEDHSDTAIAYNNLAVSLLDQGKHREALELYEKALAIQSKLHGEKHPHTAMVHYGLAYGQELLGDYARAEEQYLTAAKSYQGARLTMSASGLVRSGSAEKSPLPRLAAVLARNGKPALAWKYLEDNMGRGLLDDLAARTNRPLTAAEQDREEVLQGELARVEKRLGELSANKKPIQAEADKLSRQRDQLLADLLQFQGDMEKNHGVAAGKVFALEKIQARLPENAALIRWVDLSGEPTAKDPSGEHWGVVVRRRGTPIWVKLKGSAPDGGWSAKDDKLLADARRQLMRPDPSFDWDALASNLARQRLAPLREHLVGVKQLIVLPSLASQGIPVETFTSQYLVSYAPSGTIYAWLQENRKEMPPDSAALLALADPVFSAEDAKANKELVLLRGKNLLPLPGTRGEVEAISALFRARNNKVQTFLGLEANGKNLDRLGEKKQLTNFRYVHLATHGFADARGGMNSYLALTPEDFAASSHDKLTAAHILRTWKLDADLVTLSACQTALGEHRGGDGYLGFAQALFLTGARSLVLSQWPVSDLSTTLFMERFYQNLLGARPGLKQSMAKVQALAEAKSWLRGLSREDVWRRLKELCLPFEAGQLSGERPFEHPHYWAAFVLIGNPGEAK